LIVERGCHALFIECARSNGRQPYLRVAEGYSITENGVRKSKKRIVKNIGPLSKFDDGLPNYVERLKKSFKEGKPLIPELQDLADGNPTKELVTITINRNSNYSCELKLRNIGYFLLDSIYDALGIYDVLNLHKSRSKLDIDLNGLAKLLVFGRTLEPASKFKTFENRDKYMFKVCNSGDVNDIYQALTHLDLRSGSIQKRMNLKIKQAIGRNTEVCFYDVTNFFFEISDNDEDEIGADGEAIRKGLRKKGVSKEKRNTPIVQMGLFIDDCGLPISYQLFPGNNTDTTTLRPAMKKTIGNMDFGKVIIVADGGLNSGQNIAHILDGGNGYIVSKSTKKSDKSTKKWILDENGYSWNKEASFKVKSKIRERKIKAEDGTYRTITEKLVCFWSRKHYNRERHENAKFIEYLESVIAFPDKLKDKEKKIEKFLKKQQVDNSTGEFVNTSTHLSLDIEKIQEYIDLMGYYTIMTSEIDKSDQEIIDKYHGLSRIEDSFRITKSDLEGRPIFVRTPEHINAHFLTCFISLTMIRLIQHKILLYQSKDPKGSGGWESGLSAERIQAALREWQCDILPGDYCRISHVNYDLKLILDSLGIDADLRLPSYSQMQQFKYTCDNAQVV